MITLRNVLVATDFGEASETALRYGRDLARTFGATLHVLHVVEDFTARAVSADRYALSFADIQRDLEASAHKQLDALGSSTVRGELAVLSAIGLDRQTRLTGDRSQAVISAVTCCGGSGRSDGASRRRRRRLGAV